jgi:hypothetical protein
MLTRGTNRASKTSFSGVEPLGAVTIAPNITGSLVSFAPGTIIYDSLVNPTIMGGPTSRLAHVASTYANYRFTKLKLRIVSNLSTAMTGGVTWAVTRDIDQDSMGSAGAAATGPASAGSYKAASNALQYVQSAETSLDLPVWSSGSVNVNCSPAMDRQKLYDTTPGEELMEACQFRILGVVSSTPGVIGASTLSMNVLVFLDYTIELSSQTGVPPQSTILTSDEPTFANSNSASSFAITGATDSMVYLINPALPAYIAGSASYSDMIPIRACYADTTTRLIPHDTPASAIANPGRSNIGQVAAGAWTLTAPSRLFPVKMVNSVGPPTLFNFDNLSDADKSRHTDLLSMLKKLTFQPTEENPTAPELSAKEEFIAALEEIPGVKAIEGAIDAIVTLIHPSHVAGPKGV